MNTNELITKIDRILSERKERKEILNYINEKDYETSTIRFIAEAYTKKKIRLLFFYSNEKIYLSKRILEINEVKHSSDKCGLKVKIKEYKSDIDIPFEVFKKKSKYYIRVDGQFDVIFSLFNDFLTFKIDFKTFDKEIKKLIVF